MRAGEPTDHYDLLDLDPAATAEQIADRLRTEHRVWQRLTSHPDLDRRQLAEQRIRDLAVARRTLTDPARRAVYDHERAERAARARAAADRAAAERAASERAAAERAVVPPGPTSRAEPRPEPEVVDAPQAFAAEAAGATTTTATPTGAGSAVRWLEQAQQALEAGDFTTAWQCAREARDAGDDSAAAWLVQGRADVGRARHEQALFELRQSARRDPHHAPTHVWLGRTQMALRDWNAALVSFREADQLEPGTGAFHIATVYLEGGWPEKAVPVLEELFTRDPTAETVRYHLVHALLRSAQRVPRVRGADEHTITHPAEIERMRPLLERAAEVVTDPGQRADVEKDLTYVEWCEGWHPSRPSWLAAGMLVSAVLLIVALLVSPWLFALALALLGVGWYYGVRQRGWRINARAAGWDGDSGG
ncbi:DnaJ domain-containing protein [Streptomyces otsuchiensis]|uniref:DnaJ domain-containing protein n=1 Tax=Streptomyces otsuchiensis TaxID=2681388 RepID=UPI00159CAE8F|nr:DnaJ domain-containing protein [Streptomyces otsuchiensis]